MSTTTNRRIAVQSMAVMMATMVGTKLVSAQEASPASHEHGLSPYRQAPETAVVVTDTELIFPDVVSAGLNRVTFANESSMDAHVLTFRLPDDVDMDVLWEVMADEEAPMPEFLRDQHFPGIPDYPAIGGGVNVGYITYMPGTYLAFNLFGGQAPALFTVAGDPWGVPAPLADHEVGMVEMMFLGLDEPVAAGEQTWSLINHGATWHEIMVIGMPELITPDELLEFFMTTESADDLTNAGYFQVGASGIMSPGVQIWLEFDLKPGAYGALCFAPNDFSGPPHALEGMISTFEVV
ncbi:MAG: hypothetical protein M9950_10160 [Thermomicrobiales bacterium]|nr:hypothetical protein [Thermomicrobiales bacterium]